MNESTVGPLMQPEFAFHKLNQDGQNKAQEIALLFSHLLVQLNPLCIEGRELSICKTKLEEACFFAKKSMAINLINQDHN